MAHNNIVFEVFGNTYVAASMHEHFSGKSTYSHIMIVNVLR